MLRLNGCTSMGDSPQQQFGRLTTVLEMPLMENSHQLVTLRFVTGSELKIRKALLALVSSVLSETLQANSSCSELQVQGTGEIWQKLLSLAFCTGEPRLTPRDVKQLLPIARLYNMEGAMNMIIVCAQTLEFTCLNGDPMYVMKWLELAADHQASGLGMVCARFILAKLAEEMCKNDGQHDRWNMEMLGNFRSSNIHRVKGPPDVMAFLIVAFQAQGARIGL